MTRRPLLRPSLVSAWLLLGVIGCEDCVGSAPNPDAGDAGGGGLDGGDPRPDGGGGPGSDGGRPPPDGSVGPSCTEQTPGFGEPCSASGDEPSCGQFLCNPMTDELFCWDPDGPNACGVCGELDEREGRVGEACGEFGCGVAVCGPDGAATTCQGDHPRNQCGGCSDILPLNHEPGQVCSACGTGVRTCSRDMNSLVCWRGRAPSNVCGGCERCVLFHAWMDERFGGGYIRSGTLALLEDIGGGTRQLVFDPLVEGPGANALVYTQVLLSTTPDPLVGSFTFLSPEFAASTSRVGADPHRAYSLANVPNVGQYRFVVLYDSFLGEVISTGPLVAGPPPELSGRPDAGVADAGVADAGTAPRDGGVTDGGPSPPDGGAPGPDASLSAADGGGTPDAGSPRVDGGGAPDGGVTDAGG